MSRAQEARRRGYPAPGTGRDARAHEHAAQLMREVIRAEQQESGGTVPEALRRLRAGS